MAKELDPNYEPPKDYSVESAILDETVELTAGGSNGKERVIQVPRLQVFKMAQLGSPNTEIADFFGFTTKALTNNFAHELKAGRAAMKLRLRQALIKQAIGPKPQIAALIFLAKNYLKMSDNGLTEELDGESSNVKWSVEFPVFDKPTSLTEDERAELEGNQDES